MSSEYIESSPLPIKSECHNCPIQCDLVSQVGILEAQKSEVLVVAGSLMGESGKAFDAAVDQNVPFEAADTVKAGVRDSLADTLDQYDAGILKAEALSGTLQAFCSGALTMRARRDGCTYTVTVCASEVAGRNGEESHESAHVKRT